MRLLHLVAVGTRGQSWGKQPVVRAPRAGAPLGMSSFWIWHYLLLVFAPLAATHNA
jgi:hypothetical protein